MAAKDVLINNLKLKEGELKGKDDLIAALNRNIDKLQHQLDARNDCHIHDNPLQTTVDDLTAKNIELKAQLKSL